MRQPRIKIPPKEAEAIYHCTTRTVNGVWLLHDVAKEVLRRQLWQVADYCGVRILTHHILDNHFHVLVLVPLLEPVPDAELLRRYQVLHPTPTAYQTAALKVIQAELATNGPGAVEWRKRQLAQMGDISPFMKLVKQRFSIWFNKAHQRFGTLWAERFKSTLVENGDRVTQTMAAYIDLNCVRAGLVTDPMNYRFCGYAEAVAGNADAQAGICRVMGGRDWTVAQAQYRELIFGTGAGPREGAAVISTTDFKRVIAEGGRLPLATVLRCRIRYFTDGAVLGSREFVAGQLARYREKTGRCERTQPRPMPACTDWEGFATLRKLRGVAIG